MDRQYDSWGRYPPARQEVVPLHWRHLSLPPQTRNGKKMLPFGNGRSYGDSCLNDGGLLLDTRGLDKYARFDPGSGLVRCEAGVLLGQILDLVVPHGWFLPVVPGTKQVTVGGAIANDIHGKNHHRAGTFGCHVERFELLRSDGTRRTCSRDRNADWFCATVGGLGLTGVILWAELRLKRIAGPSLEVEKIRFRSLDGFFRHSGDSDRDHEYTVAWLDSLAHGRGLFLRANHAPDRPADRAPAPRRRTPLTFRLRPPVSLVNRLTVRALNWLTYHRARLRRSRADYDRFFFPLDGLLRWNRAYGPRGFLQHQCVVPLASGRDAVGEILERVERSGSGSFLTVLKVFGDIASPGLLSFPRPGVTLALDLPNRGPHTLALLDAMDGIVRAAGGAVYPAKDARMSGEAFRRSFPRWREFVRFVDPGFSSGFWRRVMEDAPCAS